MKRRRRRVAWGGAYSCDESVLNNAACKGQSLLELSTTVEDLYGPQPTLLRLVGSWYARMVPVALTADILVHVCAGFIMVDESAVGAGTASTPDPTELDASWLQWWYFPLLFQAAESTNGETVQGGNIGMDRLVPFDIRVPRIERHETAVLFVVQYAVEADADCCGGAETTVNWNVNARVLHQGA